MGDYNTKKTPEHEKYFENETIEAYKNMKNCTDKLDIATKNLNDFLE